MSSRIRRAALRFIFGFLLGVALLTLITFNALLIWVAIAPRELNKLTPYIEQALSAEDGSYTVKVGETVLLWDGWKHPIDIRLRKVRVLSSRGREFSTFPDISLGVDIFALPTGAILPTRVTINSPVITLRQHEDGAITFGYQKTAEASEQETAQEEPHAALSYAALADALLSGRNSRLRKLDYVHVKDADVRLVKRGIGVFFEAKNAHIEMLRGSNDDITLKTSADALYGPHRSGISMTATLAREHSFVSGILQFRQVWPAEFEKLFAGTEYAASVKLPLNGMLQYRVDMRNEVLEQLMFQLEAGQGTLAHEHIDGILPVTYVSLRGQLSDNGKNIAISKLSADVDGMLLDGAATLDRTEGLAIKADVTGRNISTRNLPMLWPPGLSPMSREWVIDNIAEGMVPSARAMIDIAPGDLEAPALPRDAINALISLENGVIRYLPDHPPVTHVNGTIHIDGVSLDADIQSAHAMKNTRLSTGGVRIDDLNADNPHIVVQFDATAPATDAVSILKLPRLNHAARLGLRDDAQGSVSARAQLGFNFFSPRDDAGNPLEPDVDYNVALTFADIAQPGFMQKFDLSDVSGSLLVKNGSLEFKGKGGVNGAQAQSADIKYLFAPEDGFDTFIGVEALAPVASFKRFGYPEFAFLQGTAAIKAEVKLGDAQEWSHAAIDLTQVAVGQNALGWQKQAQQPATLTITAEKKDGSLVIPEFSLKGENASISGALALDANASDVRTVALKSSRLGKTRLSQLDYEKKDGVHTINIQGETLDLTGYMQDEGEGFSFQDFPAVALKMNVNHIFLTESAPLEAVKGELSCNAERCTQANIAGKAAGKDFHLKIMKNPKGRRQFSLHAEDAAQFLKAIDVYAGMEGGVLSISGNYDDSRMQQGKLTGKLVIADYTLKDAPILANILSLASLTGFFDTLQGKGISFRKMVAPFTLQGDVITLKDAKTYGPAMGLMADGTITMPETSLDINGTLVPSYTLNNVVGKVPILGDILTGGGQGVFAARFSVKGTENEPNVTVNPLSMLTPGFLRNMFDVFDKPAKQEEE